MEVKPCGEKNPKRKVMKWWMVTGAPNGADEVLEKNQPRKTESEPHQEQPPPTPFAKLGESPAMREVGPEATWFAHATQLGQSEQDSKT